MKKRFLIMVLCATFFLSSCGTSGENKTVQEHNKDKDIYIIGGASIYNYFICYCDKIYITRIYVSCVHVDTYFPEQIDNLKGKPISEIKTHKGLFYQFWEYTY